LPRTIGLPGHRRWQAGSPGSSCPARSTSHGSAPPPRASAILTGRLETINLCLFCVGHAPVGGAASARLTVAFRAGHVSPRPRRRGGPGPRARSDRRRRHLREESALGSPFRPTRSGAPSSAASTSRSSVTPGEFGGEPVASLTARSPRRRLPVKTLEYRGSPLDDLAPRGWSSAHPSWCRCRSHERAPPSPDNPCRFDVDAKLARLPARANLDRVEGPARRCPRAAASLLVVLAPRPRRRLPAVASWARSPRQRGSCAASCVRRRGPLLCTASPQRAAGRALAPAGFKLRVLQTPPARSADRHAPAPAR
jgi:hypothetical protein